MREHQIETDKFKMKGIFNLQIHKKVNEHTTASISGYIDDHEDDYIKEALYCKEKNLSLRILLIDEEGTKKTILNGVITNFYIDNANGYKTMTIHMKSFSFLMDNQPHMRGYQDTKATYYNVIKDILKQYDGGDCLMKIADTEIKNFTLQYSETDWEFLKRLVSRLHSFLVPADAHAGVKLFIGMPALHQYEITEESEYGMQVLENGDLSYRFQSRESYDLGDEILFFKKRLYVAEILSIYQGGEMVHTYQLRTEHALRTDPYGHETQIGASLDATITDVSGDRVKVMIHDELKEWNHDVWFPYSTVSSSPDGSGWYAMPEIGDRVRIYLPSKNEDEAFVISSVHEDAGEMRKNPEIKSFRTKEGKEIRFTPDSILMTNNKGMQIAILDQEGIQITSDKSIRIHATESIQMTSSEDSLSLIGADEVHIMQNKSAIIMDDDISFKGGKIKMQ